jgi:hypothetical protein
MVYKKRKPHNNTQVRASVAGRRPALLWEALAHWYVECTSANAQFMCIMMPHCTFTCHHTQRTQTLELDVEPLTAFVTSGSCAFFQYVLCSHPLQANNPLALFLLAPCLPLACLSSVPCLPFTCLPPVSCLACLLPCLLHAPSLPQPDPCLLLVSLLPACGRTETVNLAGATFP